MTALPADRLQRALLVAALVAYFILFARDAWVGDDAFITLRTVKQFIHGGGLVWNPGERVQAYTHPLWMFLLSVGYAITREAYFTTLAIAAFTSMAAAGHLGFRVGKEKLGGIVAILLLASSRPIIDYSTSGLENPLTHLLLALFFGIYFRPDVIRDSRRWPAGTRRLAILTLLSALSMCNRMDTALLYAPAVLWTWIESFRRGAPLAKSIVAMLLGGLPFFAWEIFSLIYYGSFVPNTALAKLNTGIPSSEMFIQGLAFFYESLENDHVTLLVIFAGLALPIATGQKRHWAVSAGICLHLIYLLKIGGDFMSGRFLTAPYFVTLALLTQIQGWTSTRAWSVLALVSALNLSSPRSTLPIGTPRTPSGKIDNRGIADERGFYMGGAGLPSMTRGTDAPHRGSRYAGEGLNPHHVHVKGALGYIGFHASRSTFIVDHWALTDPLVARLPAVYNPKWRIGHFSRALPDGYVETLNDHEDKFKDRELAEYYEHLKRVTRDPIWSGERWSSIWKLQTGQLEHLINRPAYRYHGAKILTASKLMEHARSGNGGFTFDNTGILIDLETEKQKLHDKILVFDLDSDDDYWLIYFDGREEIGRTKLHRSIPHHYSPRPRTVEVDEDIRERGYDALRIVPTIGHKPYKIWHFHHAPDREAEEKLAAQLAKAQQEKEERDKARKERREKKRLEQKARKDAATPDAPTTPTSDTPVETRVVPSKIIDDADAQKRSARSIPKRRPR